MGHTAEKQFMSHALQIAKPKLFKGKWFTQTVSALMTNFLMRRDVPLTGAAEHMLPMVKDPTLENLIDLRYKLYPDIQIKGVENLPVGEPLIVCADHPTGLMDGIMLVATIKELVGDDVPVKVMARGEIGSLDRVFGVQTKKKSGNRMDTDATYAEAQKIREQGGVIILFPSGTIGMPNGDGTAEEQYWKRSLTKAAHASGVTISPWRFDVKDIPLQAHQDVKNAAGLKGKVRWIRGLLQLALHDYGAEASLTCLPAVDHDQLEARYAEHEQDPSKVTKVLQEYAVDKPLEEMRVK